MHVLYVWLAVLVLPLVTCLGIPGDRCTVVSWGQQQDTNEAATSTCMNGSIWWNYPRGSLTIDFRPQGIGAFSVCLTTALGPLVSALYEVTAEGSRILPDIVPNEQSCVKSSNGKVTIRLDAPEFLTYMTSYDYRIIRMDH